MSKVLTVGSWDLFHSGHVTFLSHCRKIAGTHSAWDDDSPQVTVGINTGDFINQFKGFYPVYSDEERYKIVGACKYVDKVVWNNDKSLKSLLEKLEPDFLVVGTDWAQKDYYAQIGVTQEWLDQRNITLCYVPYTQGVSTSQLKERIIGL